MRSVCALGVVPAFLVALAFPAVAHAQQVEASAPAEAAEPPAPKRAVSYDALVMGGGGFLGNYMESGGPTVAIAGGAHFRAGKGAIGVLLRAGFEFYSLNTPTGASKDVSVSRDVFTLAIPLIYAFRALAAPWSSYLSVTPQFLIERTTSQGSDGRSTDESANLFGAVFAGGLRVRVGSGNIFVEAGYRKTNSKNRTTLVTTTDGKIDLSGIVHSAGYIVSF